MHIKEKINGRWCCLMLMTKNAKCWWQWVDIHLLFTLAVSLWHWIPVSLDDRSDVAIFNTLPMGAVAKYCDEHVCVCVCLSVRISPEPHMRSLANLLCMLPMAMTRSSSCIIVICYFQFCGLHNVFFYDGPYSSMNFAAKDRFRLNLLI